MAVVYLTAIFFVVIDRLLKMIAHNFLDGRKIDLLGDYFNFQLAKNYHIAFSLPISGMVLSIFIFILICGLLFILISETKKQRFFISAALTFLTIGAISNFTDRLLYGYVIDYLYLKYFTVFNIADAMITGGVVALLFFGIKRREP